MVRFAMVAACLAFTFSQSAVSVADAAENPLRVATFSADVTIPLGHRCMGVLPTKSKVIEDPLEAHGFVLQGSQKPIVFLALDWCEVRNGAYDQWRDALAEAAGTTRERVLVCALHQHDAPVTDSGAQKYLDDVGMPGELYDRQFHENCINRVCDALRDAVTASQVVTHVGVGEARVEQVASNRRVVRDDGTVTFDRGSSSGGNQQLAEAPDGLIDPLLKTLSLWNGDEPLLALHGYATHPMSYYGRGGVSADFVGLARRMRQRDMPQVPQIYASGCSGDVTAGKYNDGSPAMRPLLAERLHTAMKAAWDTTSKEPITTFDFRVAPLELPFHEGDEFRREHLLATLNNDAASEKDRILAAMSLSSLDRIEDGQSIDVPCVHLGPARLLLLPGEAFVGYQLMAQQLSPETFTLSVGYGECWPGYIPTKSAFDDDFGHSWRWVSRGSEARMRHAMTQVLAP